METAYTKDRATAAERLLTVAASALLDKAALAELIAETFVDGMTTQERLSAPNGSRQQVDFPATRIGRAVRIDRRRLEEWASAQTEGEAGA